MDSSSMVVQRIVVEMYKAITDHCAINNIDRDKYKVTAIFEKSLMLFSITGEIPPSPDNEYENGDIFVYAIEGYESESRAVGYLDFPRMLIQHCTAMDDYSLIYNSTYQALSQVDQVLEIGDQWMEMKEKAANRELN